MRIPACIFCLLLITSNILLAQSHKNLSKKEKKELKKQQKTEQKKAIVELLESKKWVIEANTVYDRYNLSYQINPSINFVGINESEGALQLGFDGLIGWNGVGGITIDGKVTKYELKPGKEKGSPTLSLRFDGRGVGTAMINITVTSSGLATAKVNGTFGERITFSGIIKPLDQSVVYKGQSLF